MILGITGPFASGKSRAALFFRRRGFRTVDVDAIGHRTLSRPAVKAALRKAFGPGIVGRDGRVDRGILGEIVFRDARSLARLNRIVHPPMRAEVRRLARGSGNRVIDAALLFEMGLHKFCDRTLLVTAPLRVIVRRAMKRDGSDADRVRAVLAGQWPVSVKRKKADFVVSNGAGPDSFDRRLVRVLDALRRDGR